MSKLTRSLLLLTVTCLHFAADASRAEDRPWKGGAIAGTVTAKSFAGASAVIPGHPTPPEASAYKPFATKFAIARAVNHGTYELVTFVQSNKEGKYAVSLNPGTYFIQEANRYEQKLPVISRARIVRPHPDEKIEVKKGQITTKDVQIHIQHR